MTGTAVAVTEPACHRSPLPSLAVAFWPVLGVVVSGPTETKSTLLSTMFDDDTAVCVPVVVIPFALSTQAPFLNATAPVVALNAAVLKLIVIGADDSSAPAGGATDIDC